MAACLPVTTAAPEKKRIFLLAISLSLSRIKNGWLHWSYQILGNKPESIMTKTSVRIGAFEIDDAELRGEAQGERTLSIP